MSSDAPQPVRRADVVRGISWVGISYVIGQIAWYSSLFISAALVAPKEFGSVTFAMLLVQVSWLVVGSGTRGSLVSMRGRLTREQINYATAINIGTGIVLGTAVALAAQPLVGVFAPGSNVLVLQIMVLSITLYGISNVPQALLQRELLFKRRGMVNAFSAAAASVIAIVAAFLGMGVWALVLRQVLYQLLMAVLSWAAALSILPAKSNDHITRAQRRRPPDAKWFMFLAVTRFVSVDLDYVVVGHFTNVAQLGLYSLAFTIAWAPVIHFAFQVGSVLFPTAARTEGIQKIAERTLKAVRLTALILLPILPPAIVLAPSVLPVLLGHKWAGAVQPLQILLAVGILQAVLAILREFLLGTRHARTCAWIDAVWVAGTAALLLLLVPTDGIRGAALAHLIMLFPLGAAYLYLGLPRLGLTSGQMLRSLGGVVAAVCVEAGVVVVTEAALSSLRVPTLIAGVGAAGLGLATVFFVLFRARSGALAEARLMVLALRSRPATST
jgi:O-antigen/teichoic acid export membrane protein